MNIEIIRKAQEGDLKAFEELFDCWGDQILNYINQYLHRDADTARDLLQETFLLVHRNLGKLKDPEKFKSWLYAIATNRCRDFISANRGAPLADMDLVEEQGARRAHANYVRNEQRSSRHVVYEVIDLLPDNLREVFVLKKIQEMTFEEIAAVKGCSLRAVKYWMEKALICFEQELRKRNLFQS